MARRLRRERMRRRMRLAAGLGLTSALAAPAAAEAAEIPVTTTADALDTESLREAINTANVDTTLDTIVFQAGLTGSIDLDSPLPTIVNPVTIQGPGAGVITIDGGTDSRLFNLNLSAGEDVTISGLTLKDGSAAGNGGAIVANTGDIAVSNAVLTGNDATNFGGAIYAGTGTLAISGSTISDGSASFGAGIYVYNGSLNVSDSIVSGNDATGDGGGIYGGAAGGAITITDSGILGNSASQGGGVFIRPRVGTTTIAGTEIYDNTVTTTGAGLAAVIGSGGLNISNTTITGNHAPSGFGGGVKIFEYHTTARATITASTVVGNEALDAGGVDSVEIGSGPYADTVLRNTIVADNTGFMDAPSDLGGDFDAAFSLIEEPDGATINGTVPGSNLAGQDPQLGALADNGGPTRTHAITQASPAADAGAAFGFATDQRGRARPLDIPTLANSGALGADGSDIGAFELQVSVPRCAGSRATLLAGSGVTRGTSGPDVIVGNGRRNLINGRGGADIICGLGGRDVLRGGPGKDRLLGGKGRDRLIGGAGRDLLRGGPGRDRQRQ